MNPVLIIFNQWGEPIDREEGCEFYTFHSFWKIAKTGSGKVEQIQEEAVKTTNREINRVSGRCRAQGSTTGTQMYRQAHRYTDRYMNVHSGTRMYRQAKDVQKTKRKDSKAQ